jgi:hypothetical protein
VTPALLTVIAPAPPNAREALLGLSAAAARAALNTAPQRGRYAYVELQTWRSADQRVSGPRPTEPLMRVISTWRAANGAGREVTVRRTVRGYRTMSATLPAAARLPSLSGDTSELAPRLGIGPSHLIGHRVALADQLVTLAAITGEEPVAPAAQAEILKLLAADRGLVNAGTARDRSGGLDDAITFDETTDGRTVKDMLLFDRRTGALRELDRTLVGNAAPAITAPQGAIIAYTLYRQSGRVTRIGARVTG